MIIASIWEIISFTVMFRSLHFLGTISLTLAPRDKEELFYFWCHQIVTLFKQSHFLIESADELNGHQLHESIP